MSSQLNGPCLGEQPCDYRLKILTASLSRTGEDSFLKILEAFRNPEITVKTQDYTAPLAKVSRTHPQSALQGPADCLPSTIDRSIQRERERERDRETDTFKRVYVFKSSRGFLSNRLHTCLHPSVFAFLLRPRAPMSMTKNIYTVNWLFKIL